MAQDGLDPGPDGTYPWFPRGADGAPLWSDSELTDGHTVIVNGLPIAPMPRGIRRRVRRTPSPMGVAVYYLDVTPRNSAGSPVNPPLLPTSP